MNWAQNSMVVVNPRAKPLRMVKYTGEFYTMKHYSYYVAVGAVRIKATSTNTSITSVGFKNPDGSINIPEVANNSTSAISPVIQVGTQSFTPALPAMSANTFMLGGTPSTGNWVPGTTAVLNAPLRHTISPITGTLGVYDIEGTSCQTSQRSDLRENARGWSGTGRTRAERKPLPVYT